jgi:hypothetical protein
MGKLAGTMARLADYMGNLYMGNLARKMGKGE